MKSNENQVLALAAIFQAAATTSQLANENKTDRKAEEILLYSLLQTEAKEVTDVYKNPQELKLGLKILKEVTTGRIKAKFGVNILRYAFALMQLRKRLLKKSKNIAKITQDMEKAKQKLNQLPLTHESVIHVFALSYLDNISPLGARIYVEGNAAYLKNDQTADRIRALLLAGIRAAVLWHQYGGHKWQLIFKRDKIRQTCDLLLTSI